MFHNPFTGSYEIMNGDVYPSLSNLTLFGLPVPEAAFEVYNAASWYHFDISKEKFFRGLPSYTQSILKQRIHNLAMSKSHPGVRSGFYISDLGIVTYISISADIWWKRARSISKAYKIG
jgi:hypothetical protein